MSQSEIPAHHIATIAVDLEVEPLECGFQSFAKYMYLRKRRPDLVTIAGRPGSGKTAMAMQLAVAVSSHTPTLVFSLEMSKDQLKGRVLSLMTGRSSAQLKHPANQPLIAETNGRLSNTRLFIDDENSITIDMLCARSHSFARRYGLGLIVIDYLQIVNTHAGRSKAEEIGVVCERLKSLAKDLNIPVVALAQMSRAFDTRVADNPEARPVMSDLADGSAIEKWSDTVLVLHKSGSHNVTVFALKNRHGEPKDLSFGFSGELTRFVDHGDASL